MNETCGFLFACCFSVEILKFELDSTAIERNMKVLSSSIGKYSLKTLSKLPELKQLPIYVGNSKLAPNKFEIFILNEGFPEAESFLIHRKLSPGLSYIQDFRVKCIFSKIYKTLQLDFVARQTFSSLETCLESWN